MRTFDLWRAKESPGVEPDLDALEKTHWYARSVAAGDLAGLDPGDVLADRETGEVFLARRFPDDVREIGRLLPDRARRVLYPEDRLMTLGEIEQRYAELRGDGRIFPNRRVSDENVNTMALALQEAGFVRLAVP